MPLRQSEHEQEPWRDSAHGPSLARELSQGGAELPKCSALNAPDTREGCEVAERVMCVVPPNTETGNK